MTIYLIGIIPGAISGIAYVLWGTRLIKPNENYRWSVWVFWYHRLVGFIVIPFLAGPLTAYIYGVLLRREGARMLLWRFSISLMVCCIIGFLGSLIGPNKKYWKSGLKVIITIIFSFGLLLPLLYYLIIT